MPGVTTVWGSAVRLDRPLHPCIVDLVDPVGVAVNSDGANGATKVPAAEAHRRGLYVPPGADSVPLACYHPLDRGPRRLWTPAGRRAPYGLDAPESAGPEDDPWGYVVVGGRPVIQGPEDPAPGFYVSCTALVDGRWPRTSPHRFFDAAAVPGWTIPRGLDAQYHVALGDLALLRRGPYSVWAQACDAGPAGDSIELSPRACELLDINPDARRGGCSAQDGVLVTILPGSRATYWAGGITRPQSADLLQDVGERAAKAAGLYLFLGGEP